MLELKSFNPFKLKPTHLLNPDIYFDLERKLRESGKAEFEDPIIILGEEQIIYDGHHKTAITRNQRKGGIFGHHILSQKDFLQIPKKYWHAEYTPETHTYEQTYVVLRKQVLADDEVFN
ncbi:MAG: hypothetical protein WC916_03980 [Candidatus Woesearchaeota archaeon]